MEFEKTEPTPDYIFHFQQRDGSQSQVDFSAPGERGDFAFYHQPEYGQQQYFYSYHTDTGPIFEFVLSNIASQPDAEQQFEQLFELLGQYEQTDMEPIRLSESKFSIYQLQQIRDLVRQRHRLASYKTGDLSLKADDDDYITCTMTDGDRVVEIPSRQIWQFAAGMVWRSYGDPGESFSHNSRHSTVTYLEAIMAATEGLLAREQPNQA